MKGLLVGKMTPGESQGSGPLTCESPGVVDGLEQ